MLDLASSPAVPGNLLWFKHGWDDRNGLGLVVRADGGHLSHRGYRTSQPLDLATILTTTGCLVTVSRDRGKVHHWWRLVRQHPGSQLVWDA